MISLEALAFAVGKNSYVVRFLLWLRGVKVTQGVVDPVALQGAVNKCTCSCRGPVQELLNKEIK